METSVLFIVFNRPNCTRKVFRKIREAKPKQLFLAADGPRAAVKQDEKNCEKVRKIVSKIDWDCDCHKLFRNENLGCAEAISVAITWFFDHVDEGIIIEEDCLPHESFFPFSANLLKQFRYDEKIMHIAGTTLTPFPLSDISYCFSRLVQVGASATWKRAWSCFDKKLSRWPRVRNQLDQDIFGRFTQRFFNALDKAYENPGRAYGPIWAYSCLANDGLSIVPKINMIKNIGFGPGATHTKSTNHPIARLKAEEMPFPLKNPSKIEADKKFDERYLEILFPAKVDAKDYPSQIARAGFFNKIVRKSKAYMARIHGCG